MTKQYNDDFSLIKNQPALTGSETIDLFKELEKETDNAKRKEIKDKILIGNIKFVIYYSQQFHFELYGLEMIDIIQEGCIGLMTAIDRFDYHMGYQFSTYASQWIRQSIYRVYCNKNKMIRLPVHIERDIYKIVMASTPEKSLNEKISLEKIAERTNFSIEKIKQLQNVMTSSGCISGDMKVGGNEEQDSALTLLDFQAADINIEDDCINKIMEEELRLKMKKYLSKSEYDVIIERFGFDTKPKTLQEIAEVRGISRERVRQIEVSAIRKLQFQAKKGKIENYFSN